MGARTNGVVDNADTRLYTTLRGEWSERRSIVKAMTKLELVDALLEHLSETGEHTALHKDAIGSHADLTSVAELVAHEG